MGGSSDVAAPSCESPKTLESISSISSRTRLDAGLDVDNTGTAE